MLLAKIQDTYIKCKNASFFHQKALKKLKVTPTTHQKKLQKLTNEMISVISPEPQISSGISANLVGIRIQCHVRDGKHH